MTISRRNVLLGATATAALLPIAARAQTTDVAIGIIYPFSGSSAQIGVDAQKAFETAAEIINNNYDFDLPLARGEGLSGFGGAKVRLVFADHQADPQKGRRRKSAPLSAPIRARLPSPSAKPASAIKFPSSRRTIPRRACIAAVSNSISAPPPMTRCSRRRCSTSSTP
jgi:hypothetical protein